MDFLFSGAFLVTALLANKTNNAWPLFVALAAQNLPHYGTISITNG